MRRCCIGEWSVPVFSRHLNHFFYESSHTPDNNYIIRWWMIDRSSEQKAPFSLSWFFIQIGLSSLGLHVIWMISRSSLYTWWLSMENAKRMRCRWSNTYNLITRWLWVQYNIISLFADDGRWWRWLSYLLTYKKYRVCTSTFTLLFNFIFGWSFRLIFASTVSRLLFVRSFVALRWLIMAINITTSY